MFMDDKKKAAGLIIASIDGSMKKAAKNEMGDMVDTSAGHQAAAEEILAAVESKDAAALMSAMKSFVSMCMDEYEAEEESAESQAE
jgi:DNA-binding GntR family transcriptional regulator